MKKLLLAILALALTSSFASAQTSTGKTFQDLLPREVGNIWKYDVNGGAVSGGSHTLEALQHSGGWTRFSGLPGVAADTWVWESSTSARAWVWSSAVASYALWLNLDVGSGNNATVASNAGLGCWDGAVYTVLDDNSSCTSPVGTFADCVALELATGNCTDAGITQIVFAPSVGIVEFSEQTIAGARVYTLNEATVNGVQYEAQPSSFTGGVTTAVTIEKPVYEITAAGGGWSAPDTLRIRLDIDNNTSSLIDFTYYSGQRFEIQIFDEQGTEVYRWSHGRAFILPVIFRQLAAGDSLHFEASVELRENDPNFGQNGDPLPPGTYRVQMSHKGRGLDGAGTAVFKIEPR